MPIVHAPIFERLSFLFIFFSRFSRDLIQLEEISDDGILTLPSKDARITNEDKQSTVPCASSSSCSC